MTTFRGGPAGWESRFRRIYLGGGNDIGQMFFTPAYPFWSLMIIAVDVVALWGLCAYGNRENLPD